MYSTIAWPNAAALCLLRHMDRYSRAKIIHKTSDITQTRVVSGR